MAAPRGYHYGSVGRLRTVEGSCGRAGEHRYALDVLGVDVCDGLGRSLGVELRAAASAEVVHRDAVDDIQRVGRLADGLVAPEHHLGGSADSGRRGVDVHARHLAVERVDEIGVLDGGEQVGLDLLHIVAQGLLVAPDAECGDDSALKFRAFLPERDVENPPLANLPAYNRVAERVELERSSEEVARDEEGEMAVNVGDCSGRCSLHDNCRARNCGARAVGHRSRHRHGGRLRGVGEVDVVSVDSPADFQRREELCADGFYRLVFHRQRHFPVKVRYADEEKVGALFLDAVYRLGERDVLQLKRQADIIGLESGGRPDRQQEENQEQEQAAAPLRNSVSVHELCGLRNHPEWERSLVIS